MRQAAGKMGTYVAMVLLLTLSALFAPLTVAAAEPGNPIAMVHQKAAEGHNHAGFSSCHKIAACEVPVAMLFHDRAVIAGTPSNVTFPLSDRAPASTALEAPLPPPKAQSKGA